MKDQLTNKRIANFFVLGLYLLTLPINTSIYAYSKITHTEEILTTGEVLSEHIAIPSTSPATEGTLMMVTETTVPTTTPVIPTPTLKSITATNTPIPPTQTPVPVVTNPPSTCPASTQSCVPCNAGDLYCRYIPGESTGYLGWACQNNNPGNIRPATFKNTIITNNGGSAPCGDTGGYMVFKTYTDGFNGLKAYLKGISYGQHNSYTECLPNGTCTLIEFFSHYAPAADQNDPDSYANNVANQIGVDANSTTLRWIVDNKLTALASAIQVHEGWFVE